ncbi:hypothetical protein WICANDRAFT_80946 [Wickerhamomyces anomalus NRRL Y-366-8]|uniref:Arrestin-like N-terminal domain-containing protein n=1 Tax=Wickerhamomyces anomalus (strain ATCC 58044 / CBS 1984 / NCYC 433 / NRRL Y-366-8) TaxID=683960 RepID=A0A1E3NX00_WICAA|nr:uncharacterized protein WICANDRAFT_80946 [Wickerhamomyces anomalus NRRL Y-366-8]ODQ57615.1 hypothetical protein WICANDRAFT_80946 [Wickerhamomyces anomalus NRRL Y-366-8]
MGACDVKLTLKNERANYITSLDTLRGKVELNVNSEITVENVQIKFEGFAKTKIEVKERVHNGNSSQTRTQIKRESHTLVYNAVTLFPPSNVREVSDNKKFTLTPGKYEYDFEIKVPLLNQCADGGAYGSHQLSVLPPTSSLSDLFNIHYLLKVTVRRTTWYKANIREIKPVNLRPFDPIDEIIAFSQPLFLRKDEVFKGMIPKRIALTEKPTGPESYKIPEKKSLGGKSSRFLKSVFGGQVDEPNYVDSTIVPFSLEIRINGPYLSMGQTPNLSLFITSKYGPERYKGIDNQTSGLGSFYLHHLKIDLASSICLVAQSARKLLLPEYSIFHQKDLNYPIDLANLQPNPLSNETSNSLPYELELDRSMFEGDAVVRADIPPTCRTCNIEISYKLKVTATFVENIDSWSSKKIEVQAPVTILSGIPAPEEYIEMRQIPPHIAQQVLRNYPPEMFAGGNNMGVEAIFSNDAEISPKILTGEKVDGNQLPSYQSATQS